MEVFVVEAGYLTSQIFDERLAGPLSLYPQFAASRRDWVWPSEKVVTVCRGADGAEGVSITSGGRVVATIVRDHLSRFVVDRPIEHPATAWDVMFRSLLPFDRSGFAMMAVAALDIALWDLLVKSSGTSLVDLLGGATASDLPSYVTAISPNGLPAGFRGVKIPMPYGPEGCDRGVAENVRRLRAARDAVGPDGWVMLDAFMAWDVDYTLRMLKATEDLDVLWFEDPLPPQDIAGYRALKKRGGDALRLALGNFCFGLWDCLPFVEEKLVSFMQPDVAWAGGVTEARRIAAASLDAGVPVIFHNGAEQPWAVSLSAALVPDQPVEYVSRGANNLLTALLENIALPERGRVAVDRSSRGNVLNREAVARNRVPF